MAHKNKRKRTRANPDAATSSAKHERPRKHFFRQRAHCNPLSRSDGFDYPQTPQEISFWKDDFSPDWLAKLSNPTTEVYADVGCGFGGLLIGLAQLCPNAISIGFEIRDKVTKYVKQRILHLRDEHPGEYQNVSVLRANAMRYLPNFFQKGQLTKMFFCFPDPQFKKKLHRRRIISDVLPSGPPRREAGGLPRRAFTKQSNRRGSLRLRARLCGQCGRRGDHGP